MPFINEDFLLNNRTAKRLYRTFAEDRADSRLSLPSSAARHRRKPAVPESVRDLAGGRSLQMARHAGQRRRRALLHRRRQPRTRNSWRGPGTVPHTLRNPLYHWTHLELKRYFGIDELLDERSAPRIWERANALLATPELRAHGILQRFHVTHLCTTDDPADDLACHRAIRASGLGHAGLSGVPPGQGAERPSAGSASTPGWSGWRRPATSTSRCLQDFTDALRRRHDDFHALGARLSDHGLEPVLRRFLLRTGGRRDLRQGAQRAGCRRRRSTRSSHLI